ncbi:hypothetical protein NM688_g1622 [Phlebia brevispora]|uniref:Uncharacterized protein n=1 Tax=Phlebia brevispora TaxID=194682 RepID=A0ACC1TAK7_9APHY|nr:hypothetical protein NM688_g1622 [Phlebia brevispora]
MARKPKMKKGLRIDYQRNRCYYTYAQATYDSYTQKGFLENAYKYFPGDTEQRSETITVDDKGRQSSFCVFSSESFCTYFDSDGQLCVNGWALVLQISNRNRNSYVHMKPFDAELVTPMVNLMPVFSPDPPIRLPLPILESAMDAEEYDELNASESDDTTPTDVSDHGTESSNALSEMVAELDYNEAVVNSALNTLDVDEEEGVKCYTIYRNSAVAEEPKSNVATSGSSEPRIEEPADYFSIPIVPWDGPRNQWEKQLEDIFYANYSQGQHNTPPAPSQVPLEQPSNMPSKARSTKPQKKARASTSTSKTLPAAIAKPTRKSSKAKIVQKAEDSEEEDDEELEQQLEEEESSIGVHAEEEEEEEDRDGEEEADSDEDEEDEDDADVDEEGMERLMKLLGEDGLDDVARSELEALVADEEISDEDDDEDEAEEGDGNEEGAEGDHEIAEKNLVVEVEEDQEEDQEVLLEDADSVDDDAVPKQKIEIDNKVGDIALERIRDTIKLDPSLPWTETLTVTYPETITVDVDDDLNRELAFYKQALHGAQTAKSLAAKHNFPFTRPSDYFAEMVKSDSHMERIRQRLLDESASIKRSEEKRKEREGKKFGKQVQLEKQKERERSKKDMEERLKGLKRKRKGALDGAQDDDGFDVAVEDAIADRPSKKARKDAAGGKKHLPRDARDKKYGFGGAGRRSKQNTKSSTDDFDSHKAGRPSKGGKGGKRTPAKRPGKSRRVAARSRS